MGSLSHLQVSRRLLAREIQTLANDFMRIEVNEKGGFLASVDLLFLIRSRENSSMMRN